MNASGEPEALSLGPGLAEADDFVAVLELAALAEQLYTLEALEDVAFRGDGAGAFETAML
jgi:homoserine dehydrogenase